MLQNLLHESQLVLPDTETIDMHFNVHNRLSRLAVQAAELRPRLEELNVKLNQLDVESADPDKWLDVQKGFFIGRAINDIKIQLIKPALELDNKIIDRLPDLRPFLVSQFAKLSIEQKIDWMDIFSSFIVTNDARKIYQQIDNLVKGRRLLGQQNNMLIGGPAGNGKTTLLQYLMSYNPVILRENHKIITAAMIEIPPGDTRKVVLAQHLLRGVDSYFGPKEQEPALLDRAQVLYKQSRTLLVIMDEAQNLGTYNLRRKAINISNRIACPIVCASNDPSRFTGNDSQTRGRWGTPYIIDPYKGARLQDLLIYIDLLLPFPTDSQLSTFESRRENGKTIMGSAELIENRTMGILKNILCLIRHTSQRAIYSNQACITVSDLERSANELGL